MCKVRQEQLAAALVGVVGDTSAMKTLESFHKKQSDAALDLISVRMKDACVIAYLQAGTTVHPLSHNMVICVDLTRGWVSAKTPDEAIAHFECTDPPTIAIIRRNQLPNSKLVSALCLLPVHHSGGGENNFVLVLKSLIKTWVVQEYAATQNLLPVSYLHNACDLAGMTREEFLERVEERGVSTVLSDIME